MEEGDVEIEEISITCKADWIKANKCPKRETRLDFHTEERLMSKYWLANLQNLNQKE